MNVTSLMHLTVAILGSLIFIDPMRFIHVHRQCARFDADICCQCFTPHNSVIALVVKLKSLFTNFSRLSLYFPDFFQVQKIAGKFQDFSRIQDSVRTLPLVLYQVESPKCGTILALSLKLMPTFAANSQPQMGRLNQFGTL